MAKTKSKAIHTDRRTRIDAPPEQIWAALQQVERYQAWWPWLRSFEASGLVTGDCWSCTVQPPLPYRVRFTIELQDVTAQTSVTAMVDGDVSGPARIELVPDGSHTVLMLSAELQAVQARLKFLERWAHPVARFGHDRIIDGALADLAARVSGGPDEPRI